MKTIILALALIQITIAQQFKPGDTVYLKDSEQKVSIVAEQPDHPGAILYRYVPGKVGELPNGNHYWTKNGIDYVFVYYGFFVPEGSLSLSLDSVRVIAKKEAKKIKEKPHVLESEGFLIKNIRFNWNDFGAELIGEIENNSGSNYKVANFTVSCYDQDGNLIDVSPIAIGKINIGQRKSFVSILANVRMGDVHDYKVEYETGIKIGG